jgi:NAD(P)H-hydrate epimerase
MGVREANIRDLLDVLPERKPDAHKGDYGRLLVIGGSSRYVGAPVLTGLAALRSGVDLITIAAPEKAALAMNSLTPDVITIKLPCTDLDREALPEIFPELERSTAVVVGPGLGTGPATKKAVLEIAKEMGKVGIPALFDADGLKALASKLTFARNMPWVLTPHAGEFKDLSGSKLPVDLEARLQEVKVFAEKIGCTVLLKSHTDIISSASGELRLNRTGNPGMTVGGTGDVLSGVTGAFLAQGADAFKAAVAGAWVCGQAGDLCRREMGYEFLASDLIDKLPEVFRMARRRRRK